MKFPLSSHKNLWETDKKTIMDQRNWICLQVYNVILIISECCPCSVLNAFEGWLEGE